MSNLYDDVVSFSVYPLMAVQSTWPWSLKQEHLTTPYAHNGRGAILAVMCLLCVGVQMVQFMLIECPQLSLLKLNKSFPITFAVFL